MQSSLYSNIMKTKKKKKTLKKVKALNRCSQRKSTVAPVTPWGASVLAVDMLVRCLLMKVFKLSSEIIFFIKPNRLASLAFSINDFQ